MLSPRTRVLTALAACAFLLVPLAGCGGNDSAPAQKTVEVGPFLDKLIAKMKESRTATMELELGSSLSATAELDYSGENPQMSLKLDSGAQVTNVVLSGGVMYVQQVTGQKYLKVDKSDPALGSLLDRLGNFGPDAVVSGIKDGITKIVDRGASTVDGLRLTRYRVTVDTSKVKAILGAPADSSDAPKRITYDLYVDGDDLLRQMRTTVSGQKLVMKVSNWGKPVKITVPPPSRVMTR